MIKKLFIFFQTVLHAIYRLVEVAVKSQQSKLIKFCNENLVSDLKSKINIYWVFKHSEANEKKLIQQVKFTVNADINDHF